MEISNVPKKERSVFYRRVEGLRPDGPLLGIEPAADKNVMKITSDFLFMRTASGSLFGGRGSMNWWAVITSVFVWALFSLIEFANYTESVSKGTFHGDFFEFYLQYWYVSFGMSLFMLIGSSWIFVPWRRQLPIVFNRKTKTVFFFIRKKSFPRIGPRSRFTLKTSPPPQPAEFPSTREFSVWFFLVGGSTESNCAPSSWARRTRRQP